jgi:transcription elongation factor SPT6
LRLLEENTGASFRQRRLKRLTRRDDSKSPGPSSPRPRKVVIESSDDDLDIDEDLPRVPDIQRIFAKDDEDDADMDDMDNFIEYEDDEEAGAMDEREREERKERRRLEKERRKAFRGRPELEGIDAR